MHVYARASVVAALLMVSLGVSYAAADKDRLTRTCTPKATACITTATGTQTNGGVKAASI